MGGEEEGRKRKGTRDGPSFIRTCVTPPSLQNASYSVSWERGSGRSCVCPNKKRKVASTLVFSVTALRLCSWDGRPRSRSAECAVHRGHQVFGWLARPLCGECSVLGLVLGTSDTLYCASMTTYTRAAINFKMITYSKMKRRTAIISSSSRIAYILLLFFFTAQLRLLMPWSRSKCMPAVTRVMMSPLPSAPSLRHRSF